METRESRQDGVNCAVAISSALLFTCSIHFNFRCRWYFGLSRVLFLGTPELFVLQNFLSWMQRKSDTIDSVCVCGDPIIS